MTTLMDRRTFLKESAKYTGLAIAIVTTKGGFEIVHAVDSGFKFNAWLEITPANTVIISSGQCELGQGTHTAHGKIIADELGADWDQVEIKQGGVHQDFNNPFFKMQFTGGSMSIRHFYTMLRTLSASARQMMESAAAKKWDVSESECRAVSGKIIHKKSGKSLTFGEVSSAAASMPVPKSPKLKPDSEFRFIGTDIPRVDIPQKVAGAPVFGVDYMVSGMLHSVVARPPALEAKPESFDKDKAMGIKGVVKVAELPTGVAVCATTLDAARKGIHALAVKWGVSVRPDLDDDTLEKIHMDYLKKEPISSNAKGDPESALAGAAQRLDVKYYTPYITHAILEPMSCTAHVQKDKCEIWAPTQSQTITQMVGMHVTGFKPEQIIIHPIYTGGAFGRRTSADYVADAVILSKMTGKPVQVVWTKEQNMGNGLFRPAAAHHVRAGLTKSGEISGMWHKVSTASIMKQFMPSMMPESGADPSSMEGIWNRQPHHRRTFYDIPDFKADLHQPEFPIRLGWWRSVMEATNNFAKESVMDELAHAAGKDPVQFRLSALKTDPRATHVLKKAAKDIGWGRSLPENHGLGIAVHFCFGSYCAHAVEVSVDRKTGWIEVEKMVCVVDVGVAISPENIKMQVEGGTVMALSTTFKEEVHFSNGAVTSSNYDNYPVIRMSEAPFIDVHIFESKEAPGGIGEVPVPTTAPAVANAVFDAVGIRLRRLPFTNEAVLNALS